MLAILIPVSLLLLAAAIWAFVWAADSGQFDDLDSPGLAPVLDESAPPAGEAPRRPDDEP